MPEMIKVETGIPVPERPKNTAAKYPWDKLNVGDSFLVPQIDGEPIQITRDRASKAVVYAKRKGHNYCTRAVEGGVRVWRIE